MPFARIAGVGSYLPSNRVLNSDLISRGIETDDEWIVSRTGIRARHLAETGQTSSELGFEASKKALEMAGFDPASVDLIIVATSTPDFVFPSTACLLQHKLGNSGATAFDVQAVCSGFLYALTIADKFIKSGSHKRALVVGAEVFSRILDWNDRATCVLLVTGQGLLCWKPLKHQEYWRLPCTLTVRITVFFRFPAMCAAVKSLAILSCAWMGRQSSNLPSEFSPKWPTNAVKWLASRQNL